MPVPKKRLSATRQGNRRSHLSLKSTAHTICSHCKAVILPHTVCDSCGYYKGKLVVPAKATSSK